MKSLATAAALAALSAFGLVGCGSSPMAPGAAGMHTAALRNAGAATTNNGSVKGAGGQMPAFYDGRQFTINTLEIQDTGGEHAGASPSHNEIFVTNDLDDPQDFFPVLDAIQGDGFNPIWEQIKIVFNPGVTPHQFFSDDEVEEAAAGANPEITLVDTGEAYRCSVVGAK